MRTHPTPEEAKAAAFINIRGAQGHLADITHKTETGLVKLILTRGPCGRHGTARAIMSLHHPDARRKGCSSKHGDRRRRGAIAGVHRDPAFGSAVVVGLGGIFVELLRDVR
ncbi:MAG: acetate--CoA ligase family protein [Bilophila wadsworthia]